MDALDAKILLTLGIEPFVMWPPPIRGLKPSTVAEAIGENVQRVKDRMARMEAEGVIAGYRMFPNLRHCGLTQSTFHLIGSEVLDEERLSRLRSVDGITGVVWFMGPDVCLDLVHATQQERKRRLEVVSTLTGAKGTPHALHVRDFPPIQKPLSSLDWRIILAMHHDARRPLHEVADEVGVTQKTVRNRLQAMRSDGSIDEFAQLDFERLRGIMPFQLAIWYQEGASDPKPALLQALSDRLLAHFHPPPGGYADYVMRVFTETPAEVQGILRIAMATEGVRHAEAMIATGGYQNQEWIRELIERALETTSRVVPS